MNKKETAQIMAVIFEAYHFFYANSSREKAETAINLWSSMFKSEPYEIVEAAVYAHIAKSEKPPTVAHIKKELGLLQQPNEMSEQEAINIIQRAVNNSIYNCGQEFKKLPENLQKIVGDPMQLRSWAVMDSNTWQSVVCSNLMRSYKTIAKREREMAALPPKVREMLGGAVKSIEG